MKMKVLLLTALVRLAFASVTTSPTDSPARTSSGLEVLLQSTGNTIIRATVSNIGNQDYNIFSKNTIIDQSPVDRVQITVDGAPVQSRGLRLIYGTDELDESLFVPIPAGQSVEVSFDIAATHWVHQSPHGKHKITAVGSFQYAELNSTKIVGHIPYRSNGLAVEVDLVKAAAAFEGFHPPKDELRRRAYISDKRCTKDQIGQVRNGMEACAKAAQAAADQAAKGGSLYTVYFKSDFYQTDISKHLGAIANECNNFNRGAIRIYCDDVPGINECKVGTAAYAIQNPDELTFCPPWFKLPLYESCDLSGEGRAGIVIHEMAHFKRVHDPGCADYAYFKGASKGLNAYDASQNCDSLGYFAMDLYGKCPA